MLEDSDEDMQDVGGDAYKKGLSAYKPSPEPERKSSERAIVSSYVHALMRFSQVVRRSHACLQSYLTTKMKTNLP